MALTYTPVAPLGQLLPSFQLSTVDNKIWNSDQILTQSAKIVVFMCNHCPYVRAIETRLISLASFCRQRNVAFVGICSNDPAEYPEDSPAELLRRWQEKDYGFDYLLDPEQNVAKIFDAVCTPDFFVYNKSNKLVYRGRLDDSWRDESKVKKEELKDALIQILNGDQLVPESQIPSMGCSIKWKNK